MYRFLLVSLFFVLSFSNPGKANTQDKFAMNMIKPEAFTDYQLSGESKEKSLSILNQEFEAIFRELFKDQLSTEHKVVILVFDIDLAGEFNNLFRLNGKGVRATAEKNAFKLDFKVHIRDNNNKIVFEQDVRISDRVKRNKIHRKFSDWKATDIFKEPLEKWKKKKFSNLQLN